MLLTDTNIDRLYGQTLLTNLKAVSEGSGRRAQTEDDGCGDCELLRRGLTVAAIAMALRVQLGLDVIYLVLPPGEQTKSRETKAMIEVNATAVCE